MREVDGNRQLRFADAYMGISPLYRQPTLDAYEVFACVNAFQRQWRYRSKWLAYP